MRHTLIAWTFCHPLPMLPLRSATCYSLFTNLTRRSAVAFAATVLLALLLINPALVQAQSNTGTGSGQQNDQTSNRSNQSNQNVDSNNAATGPIRLRQSGDGDDEVQQQRQPRGSGNDTSRDMRTGRQQQDFTVQPRYVPGEFELFVQKQAGLDVNIRRFGAELMIAPSERGVTEFVPLAPPDYLIKPGDELLLTLWGSVDANLRLPVDRSGRVSIPRVGTVVVAGVRYADLAGVLTQRVAQAFRNFQLSVSLGQLRGQRVYVTGFVTRPGTYNVSSLATVAQALLQAGGPAAAGSMRNVQLRRGKETLATLDLYDILLRGDRSGDRVLQGDDVVHVGPVGPQVGLLGSVNRPAVFELKPGETIADALAMAGGLSAVADASRVAIERLDDRATVRIVQVALPSGATSALQQGDVMRVFSAVDSALPVQRQNKRVRVEGEVLRPGEYVLPPNTSIADALAAAGGLTSGAYVYGTDFSRETVRATQQLNYDRALRDLETDLARNTSTQRAGSAGEEAALQASRDAANQRLLASLRALRPTGRVVLQLQPDSRELPPLALEDGDRLFVPSRPTSVGVFGSVYNGGSYLFSDGRALEDFLNLAGGPTRGADPKSTFVIRPNGSVVSAQQRSGWLGVSNSFAGVRAEPGDTIFVPEELDKTTFVQAAKDWTQILYQFGLGVAGIVAATR
jgi:protein involved in polysaccharide export with SLBB domain